MSTGKPIAPVVIVEPGDLHVFDTVEDAERDLEAVDVAEGGYTGYDSIGRLLDLQVDQGNKKLFGLFPMRVDLVRIRLAEPETQRLGELREALIKFIRAASASPASEADRSTAELITTASQKSASLRRTWVSAIADRRHDGRG
jgi:hypothetical protein